MYTQRWPVPSVVTQEPLAKPLFPGIKTESDGARIRIGARTPFYFASSSKERKELSLSGEEELLSASHISGITKRSEKDVGMFLAESLEGYKRVYGGDVAVNTMWAWMGALGVSPLEGVISPSYGVYMPNREVRDQRFYDYLFRSRPFVAEINRRSKGVWSSRLRLYPDDFLCLRLPCPPLHTQKLIADFLDA